MSTNNYVMVLGEDGLTERLRYDGFVALLFKAQSTELMQMHAALGVCSEAGEVADVIKKHTVYGKPMDRENLVEELGDLRFYMEAICNLFGISDQEVLQQNANKLATRYKNLAYSDQAAIQRADKEGEVKLKPGPFDDMPDNSMFC